MFGKIIVLSLALFAFAKIAYAQQQCLSISGPCVGNQCLNGDTCINGACCTTDASQNCPNVLPDAFCDSSVAKCTDPTLKDAMSKQCPRSCKTCIAAAGANSTTAAPGTVTTAPGGSCVDKVGPSGTSDCQKDAYLCNNAQYYDLMTQQCPKTCNRCPGSSGSPASGSPASSACVDKVGPNGTSDCQKDAYLCNNAQYYDLMTQQCPKTCGRC